MTTTTQFAYDKSHRLTTQYIAGGEAHYYSYNQRNMVTNVTDFKPVGGGDIPRTFSYNAVGERVLTKDDPGSLGDPTLFSYWSYDGRRLLQDNECQSLSPQVFVATNYRSHQTPNDCPFGWVDDVTTEVADTPALDGSGSVQRLFGTAFVNDWFGRTIIGSSDKRLRAFTPRGGVQARTGQEVQWLPGGGFVQMDRFWQTGGVGCGPAAVGASKRIDRVAERNSGSPNCPGEEGDIFGTGECHVEGISVRALGANEPDPSPPPLFPGQPVPRMDLGGMTTSGFGFVAEIEVRGSNLKSCSFSERTLIPILFVEGIMIPNENLLGWPAVAVGLPGQTIPRQLPLVHDMFETGIRSASWLRDVIDSGTTSTKVPPWTRGIPMSDNNVNVFHDTTHFFKLPTYESWAPNPLLINGGRLVAKTYRAWIERNSVVEITGNASGAIVTNLVWGYQWLNHDAECSERTGLCNTRPRAARFTNVLNISGLEDLPDSDDNAYLDAVQKFNKPVKKIGVTPKHNYSGDGD